MIDAERMLGSLVRSALTEGAGLGRAGHRGRRRRRRSVLGTAGQETTAVDEPDEAKS